MSGFDPLVEADALLGLLDDPALVLLDTRITRELSESGTKRYVADPAAFAAGHIPWARFADLIAVLSDPRSGLNFTLPDPSALESAFRALGVSADSTVVVYDDGTGMWAARVWWLLRSLGHERVAVLNGGLSAWTAAGGAVIGGAGPASVVRGDLLATPQPQRFVDDDDVRVLSDSDAAVTLLCALDRAVFTGERSSGAAREGHIPGSLAFPYVELLDDDGRIDLTRVTRALDAAGIAPETPLVTYCGGGITACGVALALTAAGHPEIAVYDGSLQQWAADPGNALAVGA